jgi:hypothetical protein
MKKNIIILISLLAITLFAVRMGLAADATKAASTEPATGEQIKWQVISSGGTDADSGNFWLRGTVGQTAVGYGSSANYGLSHGFWQEFGAPSCCNHDGIRGDVDMSGSINVADVTYLVAYLKGLGPAPPCEEEGDVNGSATVNVADVTYLVAYLKGLGPAPPACP